MPSIFTLEGPDLGASRAKPTKCKCVYNKRTKKSTQLCFVGKSKKSRSGWLFVKSNDCKNHKP